jgi:hypothetical protein
MARFPCDLTFSCSGEMRQEVEKLTEMFTNAHIPATRSGVLRFLVDQGLKQVKRSGPERIVELLVDTVKKEMMK